MRPDCTRTIPLTRGFVAIVDEEDFEWLSQWKWCAHNASAHNAGYAVRRSGGRENPSRLMLMHRVIMLPDPGQEIDHINGDGLDNRRVNLRVCTHAENQRNRVGMASNNTSGYRGVVRHGAARWIAQVEIHKRCVYLGIHSTAEDAACAYDAAASELHGEFANPNFPVNVSPGPNDEPPK